VEILACETYDFLLSIHVALVSPEYDYADYDVGRAWVESARARCAARDPHALGVLGRYLGDGTPGSLHATLIALVRLCPEPRDTAHFLDWLAELPDEQLAETLLDQEGLGADWQQVLAAALTEIQAVTSGAAMGEMALGLLLARYPEDVRPTVRALLHNVEGTRRELVAALRVWDEAVFASERARVRALQQREAEALERRRAEMPFEPFVVEAMRGVQWQRPAGLRRIVFAPSYFCRPAVFYHFWRGTLTFCTPIEARLLKPEAQRNDPRAPDEETLRFFLALGDETRLRILRLLADREMYLTELADRLGLTKATTKHHMVRLRAAGLVTLYDRERLTYYALRPDIARHAAQLLDSSLGRSPARKVSQAAEG
jgi:DNA-binding transcriptional ArsR family regulator